MSYVAKLLRGAKNDALLAALWYDSQVAGLGEQFLAEVNAEVSRVLLNPEMHAVRFADVRRAPLRRFKSYGLFYIVKGHEVWIIAVFHARRNPRRLLEIRKRLGLSDSSTQ